MKHKHRVVPGHMGGGYTSENTIEVEVSQCSKSTATHPMWHFANWQLWGKEEDRLAWRGLTGYLGKEEIIREKCSISGKKNTNYDAMNAHPNTQAARVRCGEESARVMNSHPNTKENRSSLVVLNGQKTGPENVKKMASHPNSKVGRVKGALSIQNMPGVVENRKIQGKSTCENLLNKKVWKCTVTGYVSTAGGLNSYQKKRGIDFKNRERIRQ
jgi:hypothetical protein